MPFLAFDRMYGASAPNVAAVLERDIADGAAEPVNVKIAACLHNIRCGCIAPEGYFCIRSHIADACAAAYKESSARNCMVKRCPGKQRGEA